MNFLGSARRRSDVMILNATSPASVNNKRGGRRCRRPQGQTGTGQGLTKISRAAEGCHDGSSDPARSLKPTSKIGKPWLVLTIRRTKAGVAIGS